MSDSSQLMIIVGTFNSPELFLFAFDPASETLRLHDTVAALGKHSWLCLSDSSSHENLPRNLYATCWTDPPVVAAYAVTRDNRSASPSGQNQPMIKRIGQARTRARSGFVHEYIAGGKRYLASISGPSGEIWRLDSHTGDFDHERSNSSSTTEELFTHIQDLDFVTGECYMRNGKETTIDNTKRLSGLQTSKSSQYGDFGGLRHGAHGIDFSPDGTIAFVPDIGRNCIWVYRVGAKDGCFELLQQCKAPRSNDGPRHAWAHPNGKLIYSVQEHSSMVDVFEVNESGIEWKQAGRILPKGQSPEYFWADEVRLTPEVGGNAPEFLLASTRGLETTTKGYVATFKLNADGLFVESGADTIEGCFPTDVWQTSTSGGIANAIEPAPQQYTAGRYHVALTDSEQGIFSILSIEAGRVREAARLQIEGKQFATAVWLV